MGSLLTLIPSSIVLSPALGILFLFPASGKEHPKKGEGREGRQGLSCDCHLSPHATCHCLWHCSPGPSTDRARHRSCPRDGVTWSRDTAHTGLCRGHRGRGDTGGGGTNRHAGRGSDEGGHNKTIWDAFLNVPYCPPALHVFLQRWSQSSPLETPGNAGPPTLPDRSCSFPSPTGESDANFC